MALKPCPECQKPVSTKASTCPNCGYELVKSFRTKQKELGRFFAWSGLVIAVCVVGLMIYGKM